MNAAIESTYPIALRYLFTINNTKINANIPHKIFPNIKYLLYPVVTAHNIDELIANESNIIYSVET